MSLPELNQLEMLAQVDELVDRLNRWAEHSTAWEPERRAQALIKRLLARADQLRVRLEFPLVVATFGGTGTGKSTLVNALVGQEVSPSGRQRPTTTRPVLIAHPQAEISLMNLPLEDLELREVPAPVLRDIIIIDCPDPDTSEGATEGSNLERLRQLLPFCDVLIYTSTQQKYRSARVLEELRQAAEGCRLLFVQTHADLDSDIREDWRKQLETHYQVPDLFFVDSQQAMREQRSGNRPGGDFGRLLDVLTSELSSSKRIKVRRANLLDLMLSVLERCEDIVQQPQAKVKELEETLGKQKEKMAAKLSTQLQQELQQSRGLWERRLLSAVTENWGISPFSLVLRFYNSFGGLMASFTLYRARSSAQMALIGAAEGVRWLTSRQQEQMADTKLGRLSSFGLDDATLQESQFVISGYVRDARLDPELLSRNTVNQLRDQAAEVESRFLVDARQRIDQIIASLAEQNSGIFVRAWYETLFMLYLLFVVYRVGKNFFYDSFLREIISSQSMPTANVLTSEFYIAAGIFFLIWTGILIIFFMRRLGRGLQSRIRQLAEELVGYRLSQGLFPDLEQACREITSQTRDLQSLTERTREVRDDLTHPDGLGARRHQRLS